MDLFATEKRRGRPRRNPLPRKEQLRVNKRNQIQRDRTLGLKRIELKVSDTLYNALNEHAAANGISRSHLIESILMEQLDSIGKA